MRSFIRFLRPMAFLRRKAVYAGLFGGNKRWLTLGGLAWVAHWLGRVFGAGEAVPRYTQEIGSGERVVVVHEPMSPLEKKKAAKRERKAQRRAAKQQAKAG